MFLSSYLFTVKARTSGEVLKNRPGAGVLDKTLATEYKVTSSLGSILFKSSYLACLVLVSFAAERVERAHGLRESQRD